MPVDTTNPLDFSTGARLFVGTDDSLGERVQRACPAPVVKAYNTVGNVMVDPQLPGGLQRCCGRPDRSRDPGEDRVDTACWTCAP